MKRLFPALLVFLSSFVSSNLKAWGEEGHKMIASIAYDYLTQSVKDSVAKYLNEMSIEDASVWMDVIRSNRTYDYMKPLHYVNIEKGQKYAHQHGENIITELHDAIARFTNPNRTKESVHVGLKILIHLVGDLHQPLHVGYGTDKGGNTMQVTFFEKGTNLHRLWDSGMIQKSGLSKEECIKHQAQYSVDEAGTFRETDIIKWMNDSRSYLPQVYDYTDNHLGQAYLDNNYPIVEKQILLAGMRLGKILNQLFSH